MNNREVDILTLDITLPGGIERVVSNMANMFNDYSSYKIRIVSIFSKFDKPFYSISDNVEIVYLSDKRYKLTSLYKKILSNARLVKSLFKYRPKGKIVISSVTNITLWMLIMRKHRNIKLIAAEHAYFYAFGVVTRGVRHFLFKKLDAVVTITKSEINNYDGFVKKVCCIPNSLAFLPEKLANQNINKRVIAAGRAVKEKDFKTLLEIYSNLGLKYKDWLFDLYLSDGYQKDELYSLASQCPSNVHVYPATQKFIEELGKSSIYLCTSLTESFSMTILEAMSCGVCPVSFDCPTGPRELIENNVNGFLVTPGNKDGLLLQTEALITDSNRRVCMGANARKKALYYTPDSICKIWVSLIDSI